MSKRFWLVVLVAFMAFGWYTFRFVTGANAIVFANMTIEEALDYAGERDKPVFISFYTNWCMTCRSMMGGTYRDADVVAYFNSGFINLSINAEDPAYGLAAATEFDVRTYPTLIFLSPDGEVLFRDSRYFDGPTFRRLGETVTERMNRWRGQ
ncbi:MAG: DUF255 domain-containing protein [Bacteroidetes bacterium]|nr:DUF255 domain-containing protein [Bacteroidota bacterium]